MIDTAALAEWRQGRGPAAPRWSRQPSQALPERSELSRLPDSPAFLEHLLRSSLLALEGQTPADSAAVPDALAADCADARLVELYLCELPARRSRWLSKVHFLLRCVTSRRCGLADPPRIGIWL